MDCWDTRRGLRPKFTCVFLSECQFLTDPPHMDKIIIIIITSQTQNPQQKKTKGISDGRLEQRRIIYRSVAMKSHLPSGGHVPHTTKHPCSFARLAYIVQQTDKALSHILSSFAYIIKRPPSLLRV